MTGNKFATKCIHLLTYLFEQHFHSDVIKRHCLLTTTDVLSPCGVDWNSALWMTPLISGDVVC